MKTTIKKNPRVFFVSNGIRHDYGTIQLDQDEQITFVFPGTSEYDVTRTSWGLYATPSMNYRLPKFGLRAALIRTPEPRYHIVIVQKEKERMFKYDMEKNSYSIITWFDQWT